MARPQVRARVLSVLILELCRPLRGLWLMGECGTGKTHLATGLCVAACRQTLLPFLVSRKRVPPFQQTVRPRWCLNSVLLGVRMALGM